MTMTDEEMEPYLRGTALYGDDFCGDRLTGWYAQEQEGYANLGARDRSKYHYEYHAWNRQLGYAHLPKEPFAHVLGFGSAYGDELMPILPRARAITIVDPSAAFASDEIQGVPTTYVRPSPSGMLPFPASTFDLITCLGVLHHIPNVSTVLRELGRVLQPSGHMLLREPIVSMGDWRKPRHGITMNERGIPLHLLVEAAEKAELEVVRRTLCGFPPAERFFKLFVKDVYNSPTAVWVDAFTSAAFAWNVNYHSQTLLKKLRPTAVFLVLRKA